MDYFECSNLMDHTPPTEECCREFSIPSSPDSLYMYDQEKNTNPFQNICSTEQVTLDVLNPTNEPGGKYPVDYVSLNVDDLSRNSEMCDLNWDEKEMDFVNLEDFLQDRSGAKQGPTLAELNSYDGDRLPPNVSLCDTPSEDWSTPNGSPHPSTSQFSVGSQVQNWSEGPKGLSTMEPSLLHLGLVSVKQDSHVLPCAVQQLNSKPDGPLHRLLQQEEISSSIADSPSKCSPPTAALSKSSDIPSMERKWQEIKEFLHTKPEISVTTIKRERIDSTGSMTMSMEDLKTQDVDSCDSDNQEDEYLSDQDSSDSDGSCHISPTISKSKEKQYFWQYNVQSKGPKGKKLCLALDAKDPHVLPNFEDPVFDPDYQVPGISHGGKARRGDGNNVYPNPKKLYQIGNELRKLNKRINDYGPLTELPSSQRNKSRKEKNKLASRACRLKKKAQHEANKVKLMGLEQEHRQLMTVIRLIKTDILRRLRTPMEREEDTLTSKLNGYTKTYHKQTIAGNTTEFVNDVIKQVNTGDPKGGLDL